MTNRQNEIMFVGAIYKNPELLVECGRWIRPKYDFSDDASRFFFEAARVMYEKRTQTFNKTTISVFMTEEQDRLQSYRNFGGFATLTDWMDIAREEDFKNYLKVLKKYSLIREYARKGYDVARIREHNNFDSLEASDIYRLLRSQIDRINTIICENSDVEKLNAKTTETILQCLESPDQGLSYPFAEWNEMFRGMRLGTMVTLGMLSNAGKSRFLFKLICYTAFVHKQKMLVLLNEMTITEMRHALITTVINNPEYEELHGVKLTKKEREVVLGMYRDEEGEFIYRKVDKEGEFLETYEEFVAKVEEHSPEFKKAKAITEWIDEKSEGFIYAKDMSGNYDDQTLDFEIRKAKIISGIDYVAYDTLKSEKDAIGQWEKLKSTTTMLSELSKEINICLIATFQLTDDAQLIDPLSLTSNQIANAKQIIHLVDTMVAFAEIPRSKYKSYAVYKEDEDWGEPAQYDLDPNKRYYASCTLKNRAGRKMKLLFSLNLDTNVWFCEGEVTHK